MGMTLRIAAFLLAALSVASCGSDGLQRTGYETLQNVGRQQCLSDPARNPADCYNRQRYEDYRAAQEAGEP